MRVLARSYSYKRIRTPALGMKTELGQSHEGNHTHALTQDHLYRITRAHIVHIGLVCAGAFSDAFQCHCAVAVDHYLPIGSLVCIEIAALYSLF